MTTTIQSGVPFDVRKVRADFPILHERMPGDVPLVYLDSGASAQKPRQVIDKIRECYETAYSNVHRGVHTLGDRVTVALEEARETVRRYLNAEGTEEVIFTSGTTAAINTVAYGWARKTLKPGDEILLSIQEHHANFVPWQQVAEWTGATLKLIPLTESGELDLAAYEKLLSDRSKLLAVTAMSNVLGTINPVSEIAAMARQAGAVTLVDAAQSAPHMAIDVEALGCDFLALSAHKMLGPNGIGALWASDARYAEMDPFLGGGGMIDRVDEQMSTWAAMPDRYEAGTPSVGDAVAFEPAIAYLEGLGMENVRQHEVELNAIAFERLRAVPGLTLHGPTSPEARAAVFSFSLEGVHPHDIATILDSEGIAVRAGHHCAQLVMRRLGIPAATRASFYVYNTADEIEALVEGLVQVRRVFG